MKQTGAERDGDGGNRQEAALVNHADKVHSACMTEHRLNTLPLEIHFHEQSLTWIRATQTHEYSHTPLCYRYTGLLPQVEWKRHSACHKGPYFPVKSVGRGVLLAKYSLVQAITLLSWQHLRVRLIAGTFIKIP